MPQRTAPIPRTSRPPRLPARRLERLTDALFASILDTPAWLGFLEELGAALGCQHCTMVLRKPRDGDPGVFVALPQSQLAIAVLQRRHYKDSPFLDLPEGHVCILGEMMDEQAFASRHPAYHRYLREFSTFDLIGLDLDEPSTGMTVRLRGSRNLGQPPFGAAERAVLEALLPRLRTAIALWARIALQQYQLSVLDQTADRLAIASLVVDAEGRLLLKNVVADRLLQAGDGLRVEHGVLRGCDPTDDRALHALLRRTLAESTDTSMRIDRGRRAPGWSVLLRPNRPEVGLREQVSATVHLLLREASAEPAVTDAVLVELFGLSRAEAALTVRLVRGLNLDAAAGELGISRNTARAQLASVFARTGMHRQAELVGHILRTLKTSWQ